MNFTKFHMQSHRFWWYFHEMVHFIRWISRLFAGFFFCVCNRKSTAYDKTKMLSKLLFFFSLNAFAFSFVRSPSLFLAQLHDYTLFVKKSIKMKIQTVLPAPNCMQHCDCFAITLSFVVVAFRPTSRRWLPIKFFFSLVRSMPSMCKIVKLFIESSFMQFSQCIGFHFSE